MLAFIFPEGYIISYRHSLSMRTYFWFKGNIALKTRAFLLKNKLTLTSEAYIAQLVERMLSKRDVFGSNPIRLINLRQFLYTL